MLHLFVLIFHDMLRVKDNNLFKFNLLPPTMIATGAFSCHLDHREAFIIFIEAWKYYFRRYLASQPSQHSADGPRMPKSSNAIYLLFEQWECLRVTKLFSWARRRNSSQPGSKLLKATRDSLESFVAEYSHPHHRWLDRCDSKISSYPYLLLSCF